MKLVLEIDNRRKKFKAGGKKEEALSRTMHFKTFHVLKLPRGSVIEKGF